MRSIPLKSDVFKNPAGGQELPFVYAEMIKAIVQTGNPDGFSYAQVRQSNKIVDAVESSSSTLLLEDAEYNYLLGMVKAFKWRFTGKAVESFVDDIEGATEVKPSSLVAAS